MALSQDLAWLCSLLRRQGQRPHMTTGSHLVFLYGHSNLKQALQADAFRRGILFFKTVSFVNLYDFLKSGNDNRVACAFDVTAFSVCFIASLSLMDFYCVGSQ